MIDSQLAGNSLTTTLVTDQQGDGFQWAQSIQQFRWELERINDELSKIMRKAYEAVSAIAKEKNSNLRSAAFVLAIRRVGHAALSRRHITEDIGL